MDHISHILAVVLIASNCSIYTNQKLESMMADMENCVSQESYMIVSEIPNLAGNIVIPGLDNVHINAGFFPTYVEINLGLTEKIPMSEYLIDSDL